MKRILTLIFSLVAFVVSAQTYNTSNTSITTCSGTLYDAGGTGNYGNSQTFVMTICPGTPGSKVILNFSTFALENNYDFLYVYDGNSTGAPSLGAYTGSAGPGMVQATAGNASGCITIRFTSDGSTTAAGYVAAISCFNPCQTINAVLNSTSPAAGAGGIIRICQGQSVTFNGSGTFSGSGAGATYTWDFGNSTTGNGTSATATYANPGSYIVNLNINAGGCVNNNKFNQIVQVSTTPSFAGTTTSPASICLGQTATLIGSVTPTPFIINCTPPIAGTTFLPDGSGVSYSTCIPVNCFTSGQTVTSANDVQNICLTMEHSYLGDLQIEIVCPNGQTVPLKTYAQGGAGTYLGSPLDDPTVGPGTGRQYCFTMASATQLVNGATSSAGTPAGNSIVAGSYAPQSSFAGLIGCPLNGNWCIKVTDNLAADNGYIFGWDLNFTPGLAPAASSFTPVIVSQTWSGANITGTSGNNATIQPGSTGSHCYTLTAVDNFNCSYTTTQCVNVTPGSFAGVSTTLAVCNTAAVTNLFSLLGSGVATTGTWTGPSALTGGNLGTFNPATNAAGNYSYTVPASGSCPASVAVVTVTIRPNPAATLSFTNPSCGNNNGIIVINNTSSGGQTVTGYTSSAGAISGQTVTGLGAGSPVITLTNNFGCTFTVSTTLTNSPPVTNVALTPNNITCGAGTGSITIGAVTGGTAPYTYNVNGGAYSGTPPVTGLTSGTYTIGVRDALGCIYTKTVTITVTGGPTAITGSSTPAGCSMSNGSYTVTGVTGGTPAYTYTVDGAATGSITAGLAGGTHNITVRDNNGCTYTTTFTVGGASGPASLTVTTTNASCGSANGSSTVTGVTGGVTPYQYSFDGGPFAAGTTTAGLTAGTHTVIVRDANTCTLSVTYNILNTGSPTASVTSSVNISCFGQNNGSFTVTPVGGTPSYNYTLTAPFQTNSTGQFSGLPQGTYNITVKDAAGCITTTSVTLTQPTALTLTVTPQPAKCFGAASGTVTVSGAGGTPTYSYNLNGGAYQAGTSFNNVGAAIYNIGIRDANGCVQTQTVQVTQPPALSVNISTQNANCTAANGVASTTVNGGTPGYTYTWTGNGGAGAVTNGVVSGNYTVTVTDANGCVITGAANIGNTPGGTASITGSTAITCNGAANGNLTAGMTGGTAPFLYNWNPGGQTNATATNLGPGTYTCTITDFYGCTATAVGSLTQPPVLTAIMNSNNVKCFGTSTGTVSAAGSGGTFPYQYFWPALASNLPTVPNVAVGNYSCNITDANGCTITQSITVTQPTSITLTSTVTAASCNQPNGSATVTASGGTPAYTYTWSTGATGNTISNVLAGTYTITVQDANNCIQVLSSTIPNSSGPAISISSQTNVACFNGNTGAATASVTGGAPTYTYNWSGGQTSPTATNLLAGIHTVTVTDANGCVASTSVSITQPPVLTVNITPTNPKCFGATNGSGAAIALGGASSYTYAWTGGGGTNSTSNPLGAGVYGLTVTDGNGCTAISSMTLTNPPAMAASITSTNISCFNACDGVAVGSTTNAIGPVDYYWTGGASPIMNQTASGLCAGTYTLLATDQNSCTASAQITITQPTQVTANITSSGSVTCNGGTNGFAVVTPGGGTPAYNYTWTGAAAANGNSSNANNLPAGTYTVTVADTKSCTATAQITILEPSPLSTTLTTTDPKCNGSFDGTANVAYAGGSGTTFFQWQPSLQSGFGANSVNNLGAGGHTVTITSNGSCPTILTFTLTDPAALTAATTATNSNCGQSNGKTCATVTGGTLPLNYLWSNNATTLCNNNILAGAYSFTVTDGNGCTAIASGLINDIAGPSVSVLSSTNVKCFGGNDGTATTGITGGVTPYTISWLSTNTSTTQNVTNLNNGIHNITVTDAAGCIGTASVNITQPQALVSAIMTSTDVTCNGLTNGGATMSVNFGTPNYSYTWTPSGQTSAILANVGAGTYTCDVTDANGCATSQQIVINQPQALVMASSVVTNITCNGLNNGQISTIVQGGTPGYTYVWNPTQPGNSGVVGSLAAGPYSLTVTDSKTCSINASFNVTEPAPLTSTFSSLPATCGLANGSATVTVNGGTPTYTLNWNTTPIQQGNTAAGLAPGSNWNCVITDINGCSITQSVNVNSAPSPTITGFNVIQPSCFGLQNGSIEINYISGTPSFSVSWSSPISITQVTSAQSQTVNGVGAGVYTATVTDSYGCTASQPVSVAQPALLVLTVGSDPSICYGQSAQIYATGQNGTPAYSYTWSPNPFTGGGPHTVNPTTTSTYTVAVSDANGCSPSPKVITVHVTPQLTISSYSITECEGKTVQLTPAITSPGNGGPYTYNWSPTGASAATINVTASNTTTPVQYSVTVTDGCTIPSAAAVFTVMTNPLPIVSFTANPRAGCAPLTTTLTANASGTGNNYSWIIDNKDVIGTTNPTVYTFTAADSVTVDLEVTSALGCVTRITKPNYIVIYKQPVAAFVPNPQSASILEPTISFINTSQGANNYYWDFGDPAAANGSNNSVLINPSHTYGFTGVYNVHLVVTSPQGCKDTTQHLVEIIPDFALYIPNSFTPDGNGVNDVFQPMGVGIDEENYRMEIFDRWGESVFTSDSFRKGWDGSIKGGKLAPQGVYIYKIQVNDTQGGKHPYVGHVTVTRTNQ